MTATRNKRRIVCHRSVGESIPSREETELIFKKAPTLMATFAARELALVRQQGIPIIAHGGLYNGDVRASERNVSG